MDNGKFTVSIELGNDGMRSPNEVADALKYVAKCVKVGRTDGNIMDLNGNTVGSYELVKDISDMLDEDSRAMVRGR